MSEEYKGEERRSEPDWPQCPKFMEAHSFGFQIEAIRREQDEIRTYLWPSGGDTLREVFVKGLTDIEKLFLERDALQDRRSERLSGEIKALRTGIKIGWMVFGAVVTVVTVTVNLIGLFLKMRS